MPTDGEKPTHWDFMLEHGPALKTWSLEVLPPAWKAALALPAGSPSTVQTVQAVKLPDHRPVYLDYEGPVSGNRGHVTRCDGGTYRLLSPPESLDDGLLEIQLDGPRIQGKVTLRPVSPATDAWLLGIECVE